MDCSRVFFTLNTVIFGLDNKLFILAQKSHFAEVHIKNKLMCVKILDKERLLYKFEYKYITDHISINIFCEDTVKCD